MPKTDTKYFLNNDTGTVHVIGKFPWPSRLGHTHCGRSVVFMKQVKKPTGRNKVRLCERCRQLTVVDI